MELLKQEWLAMSEAKKNAIVPDVPIDPATCSPAAAQTFSGEDQYSKLRTKQQRQQMRNWIQERLAEKAYYEAKEKEAEDNYATFVYTMDELLKASQEEEAEMRKKVLRDTYEENRQVRFYPPLL